MPTRQAARDHRKSRDAPGTSTAAFEIRRGSVVGPSFFRASRSNPHRGARRGDRSARERGDAFHGLNGRASEDSGNSRRSRGCAARAAGAPRRRGHQRFGTARCQPMLGWRAAGRRSAAMGHPSSGPAPVLRTCGLTFRREGEVLVIVRPPAKQQGGQCRVPWRRRPPAGPRLPFREYVRDRALELMGARRGADKTAGGVGLERGRLLPGNLK